MAFDVHVRREREPQDNRHTWDQLKQLLPDPGMNPEQRVLQMERFLRLPKLTGRRESNRQSAIKNRQCLHAPAAPVQ